MRAHLTLAESASAHPDGTVSLLRGGIDRIWGERPPFALSAALVVRVRADLGDSGPHRFDVRVLDEDGREVLPKLEGQFEVAAGGGTSAFLLGLQASFPRTGTYLLVLRVDNVQLDDWRIQVVPRPRA